MATISNRKLTIKHDHRKKTAQPVVTCQVNFTEAELCLMKTCSGRIFKLKCQLWAEDDGFFGGGDDLLYTYSDIYYFPDASPNSPESRTFDVVVGEGLLDEDWWGEDEIYGVLILQNLLTHVDMKGKTNVVHHSF